MAQIILKNSYGGNQVSYNESIAWHQKDQIKSRGSEGPQAAHILKRIGKWPYTLTVYAIAEELYRNGHVVIEEDDNGIQDLFIP